MEYPYLLKIRVPLKASIRVPLRDPLRSPYRGLGLRVPIHTYIHAYIHIPNLSRIPLNTRDSCALFTFHSISRTVTHRLEYPKIKALNYKKNPYYDLRNIP